MPRRRSSDISTSGPEVAESATLESPGRLDGVRIPNRLGLGPINPGFFEPDGSAGPAARGFYAEFVRGGVGLVYVGGVAVSSEGRSNATTLVAGTGTAMTGIAVSLADMDYNKQRAVMGALGAGAQFGILMPFGRQHESEADHIGLIYMARAGYDPRESIRFWERMERSNSAQPPEFLSTHPSHGHRIQQLEAWMPDALAEYRKAGQETAASSGAR